MVITEDPVADAALIELIVTPEGRADPYPLYRSIRELAPILRTGTGAIVVSRYEDCVAVLRNPKLGRGIVGRHDNPRRGAVALGVDPALRQAYFENGSNSMLFADPPDHTRLRRLVSRAFTTKQMERLRPSIEQLVADITTEMASEGRSDVMTDLAFPLPVAVIGELVGVPPEDRKLFQPLVRALTAGLEPFLDDEGMTAALAAQEELGTYFADLLTQRRRHPEDDLLSALDQARENDDRLTDDEIVTTAILLFAAGFETTTNLIGNGLLALLQRPDQMNLLRNEPGLGPTAVEELLRYESPVQVNSRTALETATLAGEGIPEGQMIMVLQGAANRDPRRFNDPDRLDISREDNIPLSFGWGAHHCIGAPLARLEGEIVFAGLLDRFSNIEFAGESAEWRPGLTLRGLATLPVDLTVA